MTRAFWKGKRVLVTGTTGFKGSWLSYWLARMGADVTGLALEPATEPNLYTEAQLADLFETKIVDVRDAQGLAGVVAAEKFEVVFHLAAQSLVRASYQRPLETYAVNAMGTANLLEAVRSAREVRAVLCVTTDKCYENREWVWPYRETDALGGHDPYSSSKACAEIVASAYARSFFCGPHAAGIATARAGNVIGGGDWSQDRLVPDLVRAFQAGTPAIVRNPHSVRPWQSVLDVLHGYLMLAERLFDSPDRFGGAWNFGPDPSSERSVASIADVLCEVWGGGVTWKHETQQGAPHEARMLKLDSSKATAHLNWRNLIGVDDVVASLARWYREFYGGAGARSLMDAELAEIENRAMVAA
ncbi:MAG: CDP-glucose 4,6-dehydratase [Candidatus Eremiobacteraeota bacterium]|nr:CDP-glucose 4,6-dehydratase [Candidatus Eremiobacteraeota bacterium]